MKRFILAEHIKLKGWQFYIVPIFIGVLTPLVMFISRIFTGSDAEASLCLSYYDSTVSFYLALLGFLVLIISSRITYVDHKNNGWQLMETQPLSKFDIYWGKFIILFFALVVSVTSYMLSIVVFAKLNVWILGTTEIYPAAFNWGQFAIFYLDTLINSLYLLSVLYIASILLSSFVWLLVIGGLLIFISSILNLAGKTLLWNPMHTLLNAEKLPLDGSWLTFHSFLSIIFAIVFLYWGYQWYKIKNIEKFAFGSYSRMALIVLSIVVLVGMYKVITRPSVAEKIDHTVVCGKLDGVKMESPIYILDEVYRDTVASIEVKKDGSFHYSTKEKIAPRTYIVAIANRVNKIYFGTGDSLHFYCKDVYRSGKLIYSDDKTTGTRVAEMSYSQKISFQNYRYIVDMYDNNIEGFAKWLQEQYDDNMHTLLSFRTNDNLTVSDDFKEVKKKLITINCLSLWDNFKETRAKRFPKQQTPTPIWVAELQKSISMDDASMIEETAYSDYIYSKILLENKAKKGTEQSVLLDGITQLKEGVVRDMLLYKKLQEAIFSASTRDERATLYNHYITFVTQDKVKKAVLKIYESAERVGRGNPAPEFKAMSQFGKEYKLSDFKGKVVIIDVWATWCGPCLQMAPHFNRMAYNYKQNAIQFISLSVDKDKNNWLYKVKDSRDDEILQLHVNDMNTFATNYNLETIPRFILIDKDGKFINSDMPMPDGSSFEQIIRTALNLKDQY